VAATGASILAARDLHVVLAVLLVMELVSAKIAASAAAAGSGVVKLDLGLLGGSRDSGLSPGSVGEGLWDFSLLLS